MEENANDFDVNKPISLCSCLSRMFERLVLNRIMHIMKDKFNHRMYGFLYGRGTAKTLAAYHTHSESRYIVFLDLKSAFNKANVDVILYNLGKFMKGKILNIVKDFLSPRKRF